MLIDTHCHLHFRAYDQDRKEVIRRSLGEGVRMITVGTSLGASRDALNLAQAYDGIWASAGLHSNHLFPGPVDPDEESALSLEDFDSDAFYQLAQQKKVVAIGECGLDYFRIPEGLNPLTVKETQERVFRAQLDLAEKVGRPVIVHCREAHQDVQRILAEYRAKDQLALGGVIHCFTGTQAEAEAYLPLGFLISFTGIITFPVRKNQIETFAPMIRALPLEKIMIETDAPYLAPAPFRGKRNEPAYVRYIAERIAVDRGITLSEIAEQTTKNAQTLFRLN